MRQENGQWHCAEVISTEPTQFGIHRFYIDGRVDKLDKNVVFGAFVYQDFPLPQRQKEIDIEFSRFGRADADNLWYVVWGPGDDHDPHSSSFLLNGDFSTHSFDWQPSQIVFGSHHGHYNEPPAPNYVIADWAYTGDYIPHEVENLHIHINLWLFRGRAPSDGEEVEVVVRHADLPAPLPADIVVTSTAGFVTTEAGGKATFTVQLTRQPTADVNVDISSSDTSEGTVSSGRLVFTSANWSLPQTVTVTGVDDRVDDGDADYTILVAPAISADPRYERIDGADVSATNTDDDSAGVTVTPSTGLVTSEAGHQETFTVRLDSQPLADVQVLVATGDAEEGFISVPQQESDVAREPTDTITLTFTPDNWHVPQEVIVTGLWDGIADGDSPYSIHLGPPRSDDEKYNGLPQITAWASNVDVGNPWQNPSSPNDVNRDGQTSPIDVLQMIDDLDRNGPRELELPPPILHWCLDVNGDGYISPGDVLAVILDLNLSGVRTSGEGEHQKPNGTGSTTIDAEHGAGLLDVALQQAVPAVIAFETRRVAPEPSAAPGQDHSPPHIEEVDVVPEGTQHWQQRGQSGELTRSDGLPVYREIELAGYLELEELITVLAVDVKNAFAGGVSTKSGAI